MASKRGASPELVQNPFIKKRNLEWNLDIPGPGTRGATESSGDSGSGSEDDEGSVPISPPGRNNKKVDEDTKNDPSSTTTRAVAPAPSQPDHAAHYTSLLARSTLSPFPPGTPRLPLEQYRALYEQSWENPRGAHFVVHQHDHPVAGLHYDLRLQINGTSSASWAITYGLPGDPNPKGGARQNRNAVETRVHCLWNHLLETASHSTGSLLIWDTGTYSVLPPDSTSQSPSPSPLHDDDDPPEQSNLARAFRARKIRLRLRGARLPDPYVINLRLPAGAATPTPTPTTTRRAARGRSTQRGDSSEGQEQARVRATNAYAGATNSIGSVHQRRWFVSLDRAGSGFARRKGEGKVVWERDGGDGKGGGEGEEGSRMAYPFYVRGVEVERSVVTGRLGAEVLRDEGVVGGSAFRITTTEVSRSKAMSLENSDTSPILESQFACLPVSKWKGAHG
ncbi:DNA polymerase ligase-domain-containing protein [Camillea tinctor]|nr:DNA polymerase ligase-domain-containing protein [Camillea tinctor]